MAKQKKAVWLKQFDNPHYDSAKEQDDINWPYVYRVTRIAGMMEPPVNTKLTRGQVRLLNETAAVNIT